MATDGRKVFILDLQFLKNINPSNSTWSMASVGRMVFTIRKDNELGTNWARLLKSKKKQNNMHFWYEMQEKYREELEKIDDTAEKGTSSPIKNSLNVTNATLATVSTDEASTHSSEFERTTGGADKKIIDKEL